MTNSNRRIFYVDVGNMTTDEARIVVNKIRAKFGLPPISPWPMRLLFIGYVLSIISVVLATL